MFKTVFTYFVLALAFSFNICLGQNFNDVLDKSKEKINNVVDIAPSAGGGFGEGISNYMVYIGQKIMMPIFIVIGLVVVIVGLYNIFFSEKEDDQKKGVNYMLWGTIGIIAMVSAGFIIKNLVGEGGGSGILNNFDDPTAIAGLLYEQIIFPFVKLAIFLSVGVLFLILVINAFKYITSASDDMKTKAKNIIVWNTIGILLIIGAKNIVESIYGSADQVNQYASKLGDVGSGILSNKNLIALYSAINWIMGLTAFIVLLIIIYQTFLIVSKPNDEETTKKLKKNLVYIFVGILIIGGGYLITNFLIIK